MALFNSRSFSQPYKWQGSQWSYRKKVQQDELGKVNRIKEKRRREKNGSKITDNSIMWGRKLHIMLQKELDQRYAKIWIRDPLPLSSSAQEIDSFGEGWWIVALSCARMPCCRGGEYSEWECCSENNNIENKNIILRIIMLTILRIRILL